MVYESRGSDTERQGAEQLPVDYRDIVKLAVADFKGPPDSTEQSKYITFLSAFGEDPDAALFEKLADYGDEVRPGSEFEHRTDDDQWHTAVWVTAILPTDDETYIVEMGYSCGGMCESEWQLEIAIHDGEFVIVNRRTRWIS
jgi:hypothetical protein